MYIPQQVVQTLHDERIQDALNDVQFRLGWLPQDEGIHIISPAENKWRLRLFKITALIAFLKRIWNWRLVFQPNDTYLVCETICED